MTVEYLSKQDAAAVRERKQTIVDRELDKLYKRHGSVSTEMVLQAARDAKHPMHRYFEWDDSVAAEKYRQGQALSMIMASKMVVVLEEQRNAPAKVVGAHRPEVRRLVSAFRGDGFKMRKEALNDHDERAALIAKHKERLRSWCRSVIDIDELSEIREWLEAQL